MSKNMDQLGLELSRIRAQFGGAANDDPWYRFCRILSVLESFHLPKRGANWLDLGCHQGQFVKLVQERYQVCGFGTDDWSVKLKDLSWTYRQANLEDSFGFKKERFDYISALEVIEHLIDTDKFLDRCYASLRRRGFLLISTPNMNSLRNRLRVPMGKYPHGPEYRNQIHHVRIYNLPVLCDQLKEHGFVVIAHEGVNFLPHRWLDNRFLDLLNQRLARVLPTLCSNIVVIAQKQS